MGMEHTVLAPAPPAWDATTAFFAARGFPIKVGMIDGELAFPDEQPGDGWHELRITTPGGMITLRREAGHLRVVTWGNADAKLTAAWNGIAWGLAEMTGAEIETGSGRVTAADFVRAHGLPFSTAPK